jgi:hypothetical protein
MRELKRMMFFMMYKIKKISLNVKNVQKQVRVNKSVMKAYSESVSGAFTSKMSNRRMVNSGSGA